MIVYVQDKPIYLGSTGYDKESSDSGIDFLKIEEGRNVHFAHLFNQLISENKTGALISGAATADLLIRLKEQTETIVAGGGFVYTPSQKVLLIFRKKKWDLPKGKLDEGETLEECAVREVTEETGVNDLALKSKLTVTYHAYQYKGGWVLKESHWYLMQAKNEVTLSPQTEEDIEKCLWIPVQELKQYEKTAHASIREVLQKGTIAIK